MYKKNNSKNNLHKKTVLIADDQLFMLGRLITTLQENYSVKTASSGEEALKKINQGGLDLIILDDIMPPGYPPSIMIKNIREKYSDIPIVLQSRLSYLHKNLKSKYVKIMQKCEHEKLMKYIKETLK